jgi:oxygen-independent coproporphyrinogen-3 oxidase
LHLYVHIPFCHHICPYCGFYKHKPGALANADFVEAILAEAEKRTPSEATPVQTVYFGGGTPSLLSKTHLRTLCEGLAARFNLTALREWTLEANPATFDLEKATLMRDLGVTRISLGVQSFHPDTLSTLGRDHSPADAIEAFETLRAAGFENISVDLMFSIPGQTAETWASDLEQAIALQPHHISAYNLTYEEDTEFLTRHQSGELDANEDRDADLFYHAIDFLESHGFHHYEISNYALPGFESQHNRAYWTGADYLGLGPGAVSTLRGERSKTLADTAAYVRAALSGLDTRTEIEALSPEDLRIERIALQLRTREGISTSLLSSLNPLESLIQQGLITQSDGQIRLTREGKALADPIAAALV